jgi:hypothetical protein
MSNSETLWTVARIAAQHGVARHRVEYLIEARGIKPIDRAGIARVFSTTDVERIGSELERINPERNGGDL